MGLPPKCFLESPDGTRIKVYEDSVFLNDFRSASVSSIFFEDIVVAFSSASTVQGKFFTASTTASRSASRAPLGFFVSR